MKIHNPFSKHFEVFFDTPKGDSAGRGDLNGVPDVY
jgi:hypothetical protein